MHVSFRLAQLLESKNIDPRKRGLINEIANETKIERHTIKAMLENRAKYISLEAIGKLCGYLIETVGVDAADLPGALFGSDPESFWQTLAESRQLEFVLGTRTSNEWLRAEYVIASDSKLQAVMMTSLSRYDWQGKALARPPGSEGGGPHSLLPNFKLVKAPPGGIKPHDHSQEWAEVRERAREVYEGRGNARAPAQIAIGSVKVNPVFELMMAEIFDAEAFISQDTVAKPQDRSCPLMFRYRDTDPQPPSCVGGLQLSRDVGAEQPGVYIERENGAWHCYPWDENEHDAAFLLYAYWPSLSRLRVACGGFSSRSTDLLTNHLVAITEKLGAPTYETSSLSLGLYVIPFELENPKSRTAVLREAQNQADTDPPKRTEAEAKIKWKVVPVPREALLGRLERNPNEAG